MKPLLLDPKHSSFDVTDDSDNQAASIQITWQDSSASLEEKLFKSLFGTNAVYQTHRNGNGPLLVNITVIMSNVLNMDILKYTITSVLVLNQSWYNERLAWDEQEFPFSTITVPWNSVWTPSYTVQEAFDITWREESPNVILHSDGKTEFQLALRIDSNCNFDLFYYPLDSSQCFLSFFSLNSKVSELEFSTSIVNAILNLKREYLITNVNITSQRNMAQPYFVVMENASSAIILALLDLSAAFDTVHHDILLAHCGVWGWAAQPALLRLFYPRPVPIGVNREQETQPMTVFLWCATGIGYYYTGLLILLFLSTTETILVQKLVTGNANLCLNYGFKAKKKFAASNFQLEEAKDPETKDCGTDDESPHLKPISSTLDSFFCFIILGLVLLFHLILAGLWCLWKCAPKRPPGEIYLDGIKWDHGE
ncbi:zinc-activated ligand-gated ion channel [Protobothrops mucrosquamatus]|uniref:zinc-activated ligand-gated ion channel n=1 Tax=Protobothrops mucrosquamatus TaxID=103944 RepID=UPI000775743C|nr:zinc-activated ligand-gated ion channel [Protobothrops mucrosquamatus]